VCLRVSSSCTDRSCRRVPDADIAFPSPAYSLIISTVYSADHNHIPLLQPLLLLSRPALSFRWLSAPNFPSMARAFDACVRRLWPTVIILRHPTSIYYNYTIDTFDPPPLPPLIPISVRPQPSLSHTLDLCLVDSPLPPTASLGRCAMTSVPIHLQTIQTTYLDPVTRLPPLCDWQEEQSNAFELSAFVSSGHPPSIPSLCRYVPGFIFLASCES